MMVWLNLLRVRAMRVFECLKRVHTRTTSQASWMGAAAVLQHFIEDHLKMDNGENTHWYICVFIEISQMNSIQTDGIPFLSSYHLIGMLRNNTFLSSCGACVCVCVSVLCLRPFYSFRHVSECAYTFDVCDFDCHLYFVSLKLVSYLFLLFPFVLSLFLTRMITKWVLVPWYLQVIIMV